MLVPAGLGLGGFGFGDLGFVEFGVLGGECGMGRAGFGIFFSK